VNPDYPPGANVRHKPTGMEGVILHEPWTEFGEVPCRFARRERTFCCHDPSSPHEA
jgi:hypothetical protein